MSFPIFPFGWAPTEDADEQSEALSSVRRSNRPSQGPPTRTPRAAPSRSREARARLVFTSTRSRARSRPPARRLRHGRARVHNRARSRSRAVRRKRASTRIHNRARSRSRALPPRRGRSPSSQSGTITLSGSSTENYGTVYTDTGSGAITLSGSGSAPAEVQPGIGQGGRGQRIQPPQLVEFQAGRARILFRAIPANLLLLPEFARAEIRLNGRSPALDLELDSTAKKHDRQLTYRAIRDEPETDEEFRRLVEAAYLLTR